MTNAEFWRVVHDIIDNEFNAEGLLKLEEYAERILVDRLFINDFHRQSSMAALMEVQSMSLRPYSREQKLAQIKSLRQSGVSKQSSNELRSKHNA